ncbi:hypothetical protein [Vreelandella titanicae]|uniref:Uncharacterized protein n=1 Tax=Vreelandella titanicae TaxID=664683 RepID=A0AAP9NMR8_9GAMM|nr:hypothetical protein [Halomonas titanicae]QKS24611.1 hypothetical protein FX987_02393 [Halomonas titanicae]
MITDNSELLRQLVSSQIKLTEAITDQTRAIDELVSLVDSQNVALHQTAEENKEDDRYIEIKTMSGTEYIDTLTNQVVKHKE